MLTKKDLSDIEKTLAGVDILRTKYGMPVELIQDLIQDNVDELLKKVAILNSFRFPDPLDYAEYGFLLRLPLYSLQDLYHDLQESGLREYRVTDIQKHLEEKNYGIKNIALLSKFTGVTVSEIQRLTKHFNHKFIPIGSQKLEAKIKLMKWYGLTNEDICQVCCFLNLQMKVLKSILVKYTKLKGDGVLPWKIKVYLSNPCVQKMMSVRTVNTLGKHIMAFKSKLGFKMNLCPQTLISLLVLNMKPFTTMLEKIEILKSVLPIEEIITPEGIHFLTKLTKEGLIQGVKRSESLPELSIAHFEKSFFFRKVQILKKEQRRIISEMLNLSYVDVRKVSQMFETEHKDIQANIMLLQNYGFSVADIRKLFIVVYADTERLKYQLDVLSSRPEIQDYNLQVTSFKALNYVQYFLENDCKLEGVDQFGINDIDDDDDFENESDLRS
ncbi:hypothetical protein LOTGIDRAFT_156142 [Lottia gigantea]|uniref:Uncharacterized protein n=1 Tax=Lottia gigantea TaxID=225164 RepID=V4B3H7_LOTGI|nr:hypothetical protein LOTGIDRAFT_156142 [Lottia gigantea]ESP04903.1 hypothetical protein LOTGIDRAFT_156142 [Lottia gigantea]